MGCNSGRIGLALTALALVGATPPAAIDPRLAASLQGLAARDLRVATVAYRLQTAGVRLCPHPVGLPGMIVQDAGQYRADLRPAVAALFHLGDLPAVTGLVPGGPAARAGIAMGDRIAAIDGVPIAAPRRRASMRADGTRFAAISSRIAQAFANRPAVLELRRGDAVVERRFGGTPGCPSQVQLSLATTRNAVADGTTITISQGLLDFVADDDELAVVLGHELAHDILGHPEGAGRRGSRAARRAAEREADYYGLYLAAWAGYDVAAAVPFWQRMAQAGRPGPALGGRDHPPTDARLRDLSREIARIAAQRAAGAPLVPDYSPG